MDRWIEGRSRGCGFGMVLLLVLWVVVGARACALEMGGTVVERMGLRWVVVDLNCFIPGEPVVGVDRMSRHDQSHSCSCADFL